MHIKYDITNEIISNMKNYTIYYFRRLDNNLPFYRTHAIYISY